MNAQKTCLSIYAFGRVHFFKILLCILFFVIVTEYVTEVKIFGVTFRNNFSSNFSLFSKAFNHVGGSQETSNVTIVDSPVKNITFESKDGLREALTTAFSTQETSNVTIVDSPVKNITFESKDDLREALTTAFSTQVIENQNHTNFTVHLPQCPEHPPKLFGPLKVLMDGPSFHDMEIMFPDLEPGGRFAPKNCTSRHRVAIIVPFRDREEHLRIFLHNLHPLLMRQQLDYGIYVVEQYGDSKFNRGILMNIGFVEALKQHDYQCFIFHDVDLIPENDRNIYTCDDQPRHMSVAIDNMGYRLLYEGYFGGVSALTREQVEKINGFSNEFWGWGGEDDDFYNRVKQKGFRIIRHPATVDRYKMLGHKKADPSPERFDKLYKGNRRYDTDGLVNLKYKLRNFKHEKLYTWMMAEVGPLNETLAMNMSVQTTLT